uniref:Histone 2A-domain-containing protein n=1 Tax=Marseillevirus LCMAC102 TaxID=2506603 RepID=A0A481YTU5_9VIRU|nr:MAG: histone 2A-domain-containing protein [Marseillevirus LCMAC102]
MSSSPTPSTQRKSKKKATNSFNVYIHKVLKQVHPDAQISSNTIGQLDEFIKILAYTLVESARKACIRTNRSTVGKSEISLATNFHFPKILADRATQMLEKACFKFTSNITKSEKQKERSTPVRRECQAGLLFSVALVEKFIREFGASDLNVSKTSSVALAAVLESIIREILDLAGNAAHDLHKVIIVIKHVYLAVANDEELDQLRRDLGIEFVGGGVLSGIRAEILPSQEKRTKQAARRRRTKISGTTSSKKSHKYLPGTKALMDIRRYQKTTTSLLRKLPFNREVRNIAKTINEQVKLSGDVLFSIGSIDALQSFVEQRVTTLFSNALDLAIHSKRDGINGDDVKLAWRLTELSVRFTPNELKGIGNNGIERLAFRGGVKRKGASIFEIVRQYMYSLVYTILYRVLWYVKYRKVVTIGIKDLRIGFESMGINFTIPNAMGKSKSKSHRKPTTISEK